MSGISTAQSQDPESREPMSSGGERRESPSPGPADDRPPLPAAHERSRWKKILAPIVLTVLGLALLLLAFVEYPRAAAQLPIPPSSSVDIYPSPPVSSVNYSISSVDYTVDQVRPDIAAVTLTFTLSGLSPRNVAGFVPALTVSTPSGTRAEMCIPAKCKNFEVHGVPPDSISGFRAGLRFSNVQFFAFDQGILKHGQAIVNFVVKARNFGLAFNGLTVSAAIPEIVYAGSGSPPTLFTTYYLPKASSYDWPSYPAYSENKSSAEWEEALISGDTVGRAAVGTNQARQASDNFKTFLAGFLIGIGGAAILSAVQEGLHAGD
jgi:hypothetical protein